ncbi:hypothetical protein HanIR_Chr03g0101961 [Helianthus annuus]|nr:hypothetical protein HanIR_Chr03g0101961 [Helianthus annuus]
MILPSTQNYDFAPILKLRFCPQFKIAILPSFCFRFDSDERGREEGKGREKREPVSGGSPSGVSILCGFLTSI